VNFSVNLVGNTCTLLVEKNKDLSDFGETLFLNDSNNDVVKYVNAIVGSNGVGKTILLERLANSSLQPYRQGDVLFDFCLEVIEIENSIVIQYYYVNRLVNKEIERILDDFSVLISQDSKNLLVREYPVSSEISIKKIEMPSNDSPRFSEFSMIMFANDERDVGDDWYSSFDEARFYSKLRDGDIEETDCKIHGIQITSKSFERMGEKYFNDLCPHTDAIVNEYSYFNNLMMNFSKSLVESCFVNNLVYLNFTDTLITKELVNGVFKFIFDKCPSLTFNCVDSFFRYIEKFEYNLNDFIREVIDSETIKNSSSTLLSKECEFEKYKEEWINKNSEDILSSGVSTLYNAENNHNIRKNKQLNDIYFYFVYIALHNKFLNNSEKSILDIITILKFNFLFEICTAFMCTKNIIDCDSIDEAINMSLELVNGKCADVLNGKERFGNYEYISELKSYFIKANEDLKNLNEFLFKNPHFSSLINVKRRHVVRQYVLLSLRDNDNLINFISKSIKDKAFYVKYLQIDNISFSSGEQRLLNLFSLLNAKINSIFEKRIVLEKNILILIDDFDKDCHPAWQLKMLNEAIKAFNEFYSNKSIHLVFSTHSPLMLSDIPKECVLQITRNREKHDNDNGVMEIEGTIKVSSNNQTFGANVYDLYKDAFFLNNGFIGEYAKSRIDSAVKIIKNDYLLYLKGENSNYQDAKKELLEASEIVQLIGEPILKNKLNEMLKEINGDEKNDRHYAK